MRKVSLALFVALIGASPAAGIDGETPKKERRICQEQPTLGSRLNAKRICLTAKEWREVARVSKDEVERLVDRASAMQRPVNEVPR